MARLKTPTKPNKRKRILTINELKDYGTPRKARCAQAAHLCLLTAMRRSEAHALQPFWVQRRPYNPRNDHSERTASINCR
jgi:hypothetical protein